MMALIALAQLAGHISIVLIVSIWHELPEDWRINAHDFGVWRQRSLLGLGDYWSVVNGGAGSVTICCCFLSLPFSRAVIP